MQNVHIFFNSPTEWTSPGLSLSWEEQIWCLHIIFIGLSTVPLYSGFVLRLHVPMLTWGTGTLSDTLNFPMCLSLGLVLEYLNT